MRIEYHPSVRQDVAEAMRRYKAVSERLANDFRQNCAALLRWRLPIRVGFIR